MEDNPLLPFTVAMTVGVTLAILARAAFSVWHHNHSQDTEPRDRPQAWNARAHSTRVSARHTRT